jgi:hypothetical protein
MLPAAMWRLLSEAFFTSAATLPLPLFHLTSLRAKKCSAIFQLLGKQFCCKIP